MDSKIGQMIKIEGNDFLMGTSNSRVGFTSDRESPAKMVGVDTYRIGTTSVTNQEFKAFVDATGYQTESERIGWSFVFHYFLTDEEKSRMQRAPGLSWWYAVEGANWMCPEGKESVFPDRADHPVVQVSHNDAVEYCKWANKRLPTEAEWEYAAKGGTQYENFPWGEDFFLEGKFNCNIWQGEFPIENTLEDGFANTAPAKSYQPNGYGIYQMIGNVWEWCANPAKIDFDYFQTVPALKFWEKCQQPSDIEYATRGGSFLCHPSYCQRYRISARSGNTATSASNNLGFRVVDL